jgi:hypothetical protein
VCVLSGGGSESVWTHQLKSTVGEEVRRISAFLKILSFLSLFLSLYLSLYVYIRMCVYIYPVCVRERVCAGLDVALVVHDVYIYIYMYVYAYMQG